MGQPVGFEEALQIALKRLRFADKFEAEILRDLLSRGVKADAADAALLHLRSRNLISDRRTLEAHMLKRSGRKSIGRDRLKEELLARGAPEALVQECLDSLEDELSMARAVLTKRFGAQIEPAKASRFLAGRGFDEDTIRSAIESYEVD